MLNPWLNCILLGVRKLQIQALCQGQGKFPVLFYRQSSGPANRSTLLRKPQLQMEEERKKGQRGYFGKNASSTLNTQLSCMKAYFGFAAVLRDCLDL